MLKKIKEVKKKEDGSRRTTVTKEDGTKIIRRKSKTGNLKSITKVTGTKAGGDKRRTTYNKNTDKVKMARAIQRSRKRIKAGEEVNTGAAGKVAANQLKRRKAMKAGKENRVSRITRAIKKGKQTLRKQTKKK